ncbi:TATA-box-binding protein-like protein [Lates japonicus]|uniref:TATA-box-binding protein-like protein n=1 Tax=Lates japonicus TaxID=270547 RepID=A0AAD3NLL3_LATJO|nr:TATA-box-binding protein-like protein [Lates japonicus]
MDRNQSRFHIIPAEMDPGRKWVWHLSSIPGHLSDGSLQVTMFGGSSLSQACCGDPCQDQRPQLVWTTVDVKPEPYGASEDNIRISTINKPQLFLSADSSQMLQFAGLELTVGFQLQGGGLPGNSRRILGEEK